MVLAAGIEKAGKSTTINAIVSRKFCFNRNRPMTSVPTLIRHVPGKTEPVLHLEHIQPCPQFINHTAGNSPPRQDSRSHRPQQTGDTRELLDILTDDGWLKNGIPREEWKSLLDWHR